ncbi:DinB family protein [Streptomyces nitrosporeus]|uniref:DinB family protein n=1 Tax=Streptomyces nitrosporeus TaxID=28894 RepID=A0A5J6FJR0_9ACTN|nr:DinB family protein [Streptomyces nitrosporeus]QEU76638.1 DinB family protein [Streptomyces nitrosporeus]
MVTFVPPEAPGDERGALLAFVEAQRGAVRRSVLGLTEEQAASRPGVSGLSLSGLLKHVAEMELNWLRMAQRQPNDKERDERTWADGFRLTGGETVPDVLEEWSKTAAETEAFIRSGIDGMDDTFPLPEAPWFPPGTRCSMRWMLIHLVEEIGRHAGHADILRETLDGRSALELVAEEAGYAGRN